jgi:hypothetical protein
MRRPFLEIAVAITLLAAGIDVPAQVRLSFDQNLHQNPNVHEELCEKELDPPEDGSDSAALAWTLQCADLDLDIEQSEFAALGKAAEKSSKTERDAYFALVDAFENYRTLHMDLETKGCGGGNGCPAYMAQEEAQCNYEFLRIAEEFRGAGFPSFSSHQAEAADTVLNTSYKQDLQSYPVQCQKNAADGIDNDCVSQSDFRAMERAWIHYRDAWVTYGAIKWPKVTANSWRAYLTLQHTGPRPGSSGIGTDF